jgi:hypothetical protein
VQRIRPKDWSAEHKTITLLEEDNWQSWMEDITLTFDICSLDDYVTGILECLDIATDPVRAGNWEYNDKYTRKVIRKCLSAGQKYHTANHFCLEDVN